MKLLQYLAALFVLLSAASASSLEERITIDALIVTKAELRRHMAASEEDRLTPATYDQLFASRGIAQPDYMVLRFFTSKPGHFSGEVEAFVDKGTVGVKLTVVLHYNKGWVEYFIPLDAGIYGGPNKVGSPAVSVKWNRLNSK